MKIVSFNVNGIRARIKAGVDLALPKLEADVYCIQEVRAKKEQVPISFLKGHTRYFSLHNKPGYAGATTFTKIKPFLATDDFPENDEPGRVSILDFKNFKLINAYVPNAGSQLERLPHRVEWQKKLKDYIAAQMKPVIYCGDLNCAHKQIDVGSPTIKSGVSFQERTAFQDILDLGMVDIWRELHPNKIEYTWFSTQFKSKEVNRGMRIDSFIISKELVPFVKSCEIIQDNSFVCNSDHQIVILDIDIDNK